MINSNTAIAMSSNVFLPESNNSEVSQRTMTSWLLALIIFCTRGFYRVAKIICQHALDVDVKDSIKTI